jgi:hypothetical protein
VNPVFTAPQVQTSTVLTFQLTVNDGLATSATTVRITVERLNSPPALSPIGNKTVNIGNTLTFTVNATDPDDDPLTYTVSPLLLPANASFDTTTRIFTFTPTAGEAGSFDLTFAVSDGRGGTASETVTITVTAGIAINITSPANGATVPAAQLIVRGSVTNSGGGEVGVTVNGVPAAVQGNSFIALLFVTPETTSLTATAITGTGTAASQTIAITVTGAAGSFVGLRADPFSGPAPLLVKFSLLTDAVITQVSLDANGDGIVDYTGTQLAQFPYTYAQPGVYLASVTATTNQGSRVSTSALIQVFDTTQLDGILRAKWAAMKDALRNGNIDAALGEIAQRARSRYQEGFQIITTQLPNIDQILPNIALVEFRENEAIYGTTRMDDGTLIAFEVRFVIDGDGVWRIRSF